MFRHFVKIIVEIKLVNVECTLILLGTLHYLQLFTLFDIITII